MEYADFAVVKLTLGVPYDCFCDKSFSIELTFTFSKCGFPILRDNESGPPTTSYFA